MNTRTPTFPGLDTLRAVAAVAVVATHTSFWAGIYGDGLVGAATQRLEIGVAVFFVLSGFLLAYPFLHAAAHDAPTGSIGRYFWKRALRILPVYWVTVVVALAVLPENDGLPASRWIDNLLLVDLFRSGVLPRGLTQMWSLSTEATFYLVLPFLMLALTRALCRRRWRPDALLVALGVLAAGSLAWGGALAHVTDAELAWVHRGLPAYFSWFAIGIAFAVLDVDRRRGGESALLRLLTAAGSAPGSCWLVAGALYVVVSTPLAGPAGLYTLTASQTVWRSALYAVVAALVVLPSVFGPTDTRYARVMATPLLRHLGHVSYSLFCCHIVVLELVSRWGGFDLFRSDPLVLFLVVLGISLVASELLYALVEKPFLRLKDAGRRGPTAQSAPSTPATSQPGHAENPAHESSPPHGRTT